MSQLDEIKSSPKAKAELSNVSFQFKGAHVAYTSEDQGGAASLLNEPLLLKSTETGNLSEDQEKILSKVNEEFTPLEKSKDVENVSPSSDEVVTGEEHISNVTKGNDKDMSDQKLEDVLAEVAKLQKSLSVQKAVNTIAPYKFEDAEAVAEAISDLSEEAQGVVLKAFDALVAREGEALEKAKTAAPAVETDLQKALDEEAGVDGEAEVEVVEKSLAERVMDLQKAEKDS